MLSTYSLSDLVRLLERNAPPVSVAPCRFCGSIARNGWPCWSCARGEIERRFGLHATNVICETVIRQRDAAQAAGVAQ
jgi:hypothetical protein